jgi:alpha-galactosidase
MFQIDDGFQKSVGEWTQTNHRFPEGMKTIADSIHAKKFKAGLWLAPFIAEKKSNLFENRKDWLLKNEKGKPIKAGYNPLWSGWYFPLDIYNNEVQQYLKSTFDTVLNHQGYDMVKLDFLFAACINPPDNKTRGEMMFDGMLMLREWCGEKFILGCGVPLGTAFHLVDYCRISSDIHMKWEQKLLKAMNMRERLSVWNTITSNIGRRHLNGTMFLNDPDVFVLREEKNKLKLNEKLLLFEINNLFGSLVFTSDYIGNYNSEILQLYKSKFPFQPEKQLKVNIIEKDIYEIKTNNKELLIDITKKGRRID